MKRTMMWLVVGMMMVGSLAWGQYDNRVAVRQALTEALESARTSLEESSIPDDKAIAILPLWGDSGGIVEGLLKNAITAAGLTCVEGKNDPFWQEVLEQVEWDERKEDMLDAATLTKFGKLKAAQYLVYGVVRDANVTPQRIFVEVELHMSSIETKEHVWGNVFARRFYLPGKTAGIVHLDDDVRELLRGVFDDGLGSLKSSEKLSSVESIAMVPLAGDIDGYISGLAERMVSMSTMVPKDLDVVTLAEARTLLRDKPTQADAVLFGAVRDLSRKLERRDFMKNTYEIRGEVQLKIQKADTGDVLWSDTLAGKQMVEETMSVWELLTLKPRISLGVVGGVVGLLILSSFFSKMRRSR